MSYVEVRGRLKVPGKPWERRKISAWVRWDSGIGWTGFEPTIHDILRRVAEGVILLTPTGPPMPADSARAAVLLACEPFDWPGSKLDTDIDVPELPFDKN